MLASDQADVCFLDSVLVLLDNREAFALRAIFIDSRRSLFVETKDWIVEQALDLLK